MKKYPLIKYEVKIMNLTLIVNKNINSSVLDI